MMIILPPQHEHGGRRQSDGAAASAPEPHPHIHVIVNRVNPESGIVANLSNDRLLLSSWAEEYERPQGQIRCEQRVENNRRRKREFVKDRDSPNRAEYRRWQRERATAAYEQRMRDKQTSRPCKRRSAMR